MKPRIASLASLSRTIACPRTTPASDLLLTRPTLYNRSQGVQLSLRNFSISKRLGVTLPKPTERETSYESSNARPAIELDHNVTQEETDDYERRLSEQKNKQIRTPWQREGSDVPPVSRQRSAGAMTKGSLPLVSSLNARCVQAIMYRVWS
jgi:hypothetical protein